MREEGTYTFGLQVAAGLLECALLFLEVLEVVEQGLRLGAVRIELEIGFGEQESVVQMVELQQQIEVTEQCFRIVRAKRESLQESEIGFPEEALEFGIGFGPIFRRTLRAETPGIQAGNCGAQLGE